MTCLWLNAVVRNSKMKPIGMCGTGIELDGFISKCYESLSSSIDMYFFNEAKEITGAKDKQILVDKLHIDSVYERIASLPNISNSFRFGFSKRNSIRREYQQRRYRTLNSDNFD